MDSMKRAGLEIEAPERAAAVIEVIEKTLGFKIGLTEITEAAMALNNENKIELAATLWAAAMPPPTEPTAGVYVLSAKEHALILTALDSWRRRTTGDDMELIEALTHRLERGDL